MIEPKQMPAADLAFAREIIISKFEHPEGVWPHDIRMRAALAHIAWQESKITEFELQLESGKALAKSISPDEQEYLDLREHLDEYHENFTADEKPKDI